MRNLKLGLPFFTILTPLPGTELFNQLNGALLGKNHDLFDLLHPLLPTSLPLEEFAEEVASLYRSAYPRHLAFLGGLLLLTEVVRGHLSLGDWKQIIGDWLILTDKGHYLDSGGRSGEKQIRLDLNCV